jgi:D-proline reductase (dithiol) PrdB
MARPATWAILGEEDDMSTTLDARVAEPADVPILYMQRTEAYYLALGYGNPYRWSHFVDVPFTPLRKPLAGWRLALITTAAL